MCGFVGIFETRDRREIDRYGTNFARLLRVDPAEEIASGLMKVQEALEGLLHFTFESYTGAGASLNLGWSNHTIDKLRYYVSPE